MELSTYSSSEVRGLTARLSNLGVVAAVVDTLVTEEAWRLNGGGAATSASSVYNLDA
jgi:hypothetical protein